MTATRQLQRKHIKRSLISALLLGCALLAGITYAGEKLLFRYVDENKQLVLNDTLPATMAGNGYEIIRPDGTLVKTILPAITSEAKVEAERLSQEAERHRKWDESLLLRYSDLADVEAAKRRALSGMLVRISILQGNLNYLKTQVEREEFRAAEADRQGLEVSAKQKKAIRTLKWQTWDVEELIEIRRKEKEETATRYDRDLQRFATLLNRIGSRR
ncbi:MAG: hypothetical protein ACI9G5_001332 [Paracoccaceae bacterium]|jgi:hypothetical protein